MKVVRHRSRLLRETVDALSLAVFKTRLDGALSNLGCWKVSLSMAAKLEPGDFYGVAQSKLFYDSMNCVWKCCASITQRGVEE